MTLLKIRNEKDYLNGLFPNFNNLFEDALSQRNGIQHQMKFKPAVNIKSDINKYTIEMLAPGMEKENFKLNLEKNLLTVTGVIKENTADTDKNYQIKEFRMASFERQFTFKEEMNADSIHASYVNGILLIELTKPVKEQKQPVIISVN